MPNCCYVWEKPPLKYYKSLFNLFCHYQIIAVVVVALRADDDGDALELESEIDAEQDRFKEELGEERKRTLEQVRRPT